MNEGGLIKTYIDKYNIEADKVAESLGIEQTDMNALFESQTVDADVKEKLKAYFGKNIFDGSMLTEMNK